MAATKTHTGTRPSKTKSRKQRKMEEDKGFPDIFSPEGVLVMIWAIILDFLGLVDLIPAIGNIASIFVSVLGMSTLGIWAFARTGHMPPRKRNRYVLKKPITRGLLGFIPFIAALPLWSLWVFGACKRGGENRAATAGFACLVIALLGLKVAANLHWILL